MNQYGLYGETVFEPKLTADIMNAGREILGEEERGERIHASDILTARKYYWRNKKPLPLQDKEVGFFLAGRAHHEIIIKIMKKDKSGKFVTDEGSREWEKIFYSPDFRLGFMAEIKSSRRQWSPKDDDSDAIQFAYKNYLKQLEQYMAVEDVEEAALVIFFISHRNDDKNKTTEPKLKAYSHVLTARDRKAIRTRMLETRDVLLQIKKTGFKDGAHKKLVLCPAWQCCSGGYKGPATASCKWYFDCKPKGRYPEELYAKNKRKGNFDDE